VYSDCKGGARRGDAAGMRVAGGVLRRLLCTMAIASVMVTLGACGESSRQKKTDRAFASERSYTTTPAGAARTLSRLKAPAGFQRTQRCPKTYSVCFVRSPSIVLDDKEMDRLVAALGATKRPGTATTCTPTRHPAVSRLAFVACTAVATMGRDFLHIDTTSVVLATAGRAQSSTRSFRGTYQGSMLEVTDIGH